MMMTSTYKHIVHYYETDRMGITHHSNYIRWMEEARVYYLKEIGWGYDHLEEIGIMYPVTKVDCSYKHTTTFADEVSIHVSVEEFKGVRLKLKYMMYCKEQLVCEAYSEHCFLNKDGLPIRIKKEYPEFYEALVNEER